MVSVKQQYEAFPYPERDPADEAKRLITGSPSHPVEMDHFLWGGQRDWSRPLRVLVAGGGTGDGLIQLATMLTKAKKPYEITYLDLSEASRSIAEARARMRRLEGITFHTASLLEAPDHGQFDYIDCCGVLHHLPDPAAGFAALRAALAPGGGLGFMVYAPYGRSGVYPLQEAFGALFAGLPPAARLAEAKRIVADLPKGHPFRTNLNLGDHHQSDAGFYDLLLHGQDRAYDVTSLLDELSGADLSLAGLVTPALYDLSRIAAVPEGMPEHEAMAVAEKLRGTLKMHTGYAVPRSESEGAAGDKRGTKTGRDSGPPARGRARGQQRSNVPHLQGVAGQALARAVAQGRRVPVKVGQFETSLVLDRAAAPLIAAINGRRSLDEIALGAGLDPMRFGVLWAALERALEPWGLLLYSRLLR